MAADAEAWCEACGEWREGDECPSCGEVLGEDVEEVEDVEEEPPPVPWHFKFLVVAVVLYLGWRAVQGIVWLVGRF